MKEAMQREMVQNKNVRFLIDGFPRNEDNLEGWNKYMDGQSVHLKGVILFEIDLEITKQRIMHRDRDKNDRLEVLDERISRRQQKAEPVIAYYQRLKLLHQIDANRSVHEVFKDFNQKLIALFQQI